jgi:beta-glucosidase
VNPLGLFDLNRNIRKVGEAYKKLIHDWRDVLPVQSECLAVPLVPPSQYSEPWAQHRREAMRGHRSRSLIAQIHTPQRGTH